MFVASGPGSARDEFVDGARLLDVAPAILRRFGPIQRVAAGLATLVAFDPQVQFDALTRGRRHASTGGRDPTSWPVAGTFPAADGWQAVAEVVRRWMRRQTPQKNLGFFWGVTSGKRSWITFSTDG